MLLKNLDKNSIGYEINPEFTDIIKNKLNVYQKNLNETTYEFITQKFSDSNFENQIQTLPYIFKDTHSLNKKVNIKKLQFGSRIDLNSPSKNEEFLLLLK